MIVIKREAISEAGFRPCSTEGPKGGGGAVRCGGCPTSLPAPTETKTALLDNSRKACCEILLGSLILTGRECWARHKWERIIPQCKMYKPNLKYLSPTRREPTRKSTRFFFYLTQRSRLEGLFCLRSFKSRWWRGHWIEREKRRTFLYSILSLHEGLGPLIHWLYKQVINRATFHEAQGEENQIHCAIRSEKTTEVSQNEIKASDSRPLTLRIRV